MEISVTDHADVRAILADPRFTVPLAGPADRAGTVAWLRAHVSRFCEGAAHDRRRAVVEGLLGDLDPEALCRAARETGGHVRALALALGAAPDDLEAVDEDVRRVAAAYQSGDPAADDAVASLGEVFASPHPELTAVRIQLLVQACDATAALISGARRTGDLDRALRDEPPVTATRRVCRERALIGERVFEPGDVLVLDLATPDLTFGHGRRPCPGREHALALAAGVLEAVR